MTRPIALTESQRRRLERLARDAGRTPAEVFRFVLRDGFEFCEWEVRESLDAEADTGARGAVPHEIAQRRAREVIAAGHARRRSRKAA